MRKETYKKGMNTYERITRPTARKLFVNGVTLDIYTSLANPDSMWVSGCSASRRDLEIERGEALTDSEARAEFDKWVNAFEYYNCNPEMGKHAKFFASVDDLVTV